MCKGYKTGKGERKLEMGGGRSLFVYFTPSAGGTCLGDHSYDNDDYFQLGTAGP
jgi:hypothetical protein